MRGGDRTRVGVFVDRQGRRRVQEKDVRKANGDPREVVAHGGDHLAGDQVAPPWPCQGDCLLDPHRLHALSACPSQPIIRLVPSGFVSHKMVSLELRSFLLHFPIKYRWL